MSLDENNFDVGAGNPGMVPWDDDDFYSESLQQVRGRTQMTSHIH